MVRADGRNRVIVEGFRFSKIVFAAALLSLIAVSLTACPFGDARRAAWQSRAKGTLRSIGSSQLAYQNSNADKSYGTFEDLRDALYVAQGYTLENMIEAYTISWTAYSSSPAEEAGSEEGKPVFEDTMGSTKTHEPYDSFTIIAYPTAGSRGLCTFAVTEDQVVRVYNPGNRNKENDVLTWDPIL